MHCYGQLIFILLHCFLQSMKKTVNCLDCFQCKLLRKSNSYLVKVNYCNVEALISPCQFNGCFTSNQSITMYKNVSKFVVVCQLAPCLIGKWVNYVTNFFEINRSSKNTISRNIR